MGAPEDFVRIVGLLSPREVQAAILIAEGHRTTDVAELLGTSVGAATQLRASIRRKLGVKPKEDLPGLLRSALEGFRGDGPSSPASPPQVERRVHLHLRVGLNEVGNLARRLEARSRALRSAAARSDTDGTALRWEAERLEHLVCDLDRVREDGIGAARATTAQKRGTTTEG